MKKAVIVAIVVILVGWAAVHLWGPSTPPPGQRPLATLAASNFTEFSAAFDTGIDLPRLVLLVSPT